MSFQQARSDRGYQIHYPNAPDARGSTRVHYLRRPYYLGPHESPQSHVMFGLWKHHLIKNGKPPRSKDLRPIVDALLADESTAYETPRLRRCLPVAASTLGGLFLGFVFAAAIFSTDMPPKVDGRVLTEDELAFVRGLRDYEEAMQNHPLTNAGRVAGLTRKLMEGENEQGLLHTSE